MNPDKQTETQMIAASMKKTQFLKVVAERSTSSERSSYANTVPDGEPNICKMDQLYSLLFFKLVELDHGRKQVK